MKEIIDNVWNASASAILKPFEFAVKLVAIYYLAIFLFALVLIVTGLTGYLKRRKELGS